MTPRQQPPLEQTPADGALCRADLPSRADIDAADETIQTNETIEAPPRALRQRDCCTLPDFLRAICHHDEDCAACKASNKPLALQLIRRCLHRPGHGQLWCEHGYLVTAYCSATSLMVVAWILVDKRSVHEWSFRCQGEVNDKMALTGGMLVRLLTPPVMTGQDPAHLLTPLALVASLPVRETVFQLPCAAPNTPEALESLRTQFLRLRSVPTCTDHRS